MIVVGFIIGGKTTNNGKIADALEVSLDYLAGEAARTVDKQTMKLIQDIEELEPSIREKLFFLANAVIRDSKTKKAYTL